MSDLIGGHQVNQPGDPVQEERVSQETMSFIRNSRAKNTVDAYRSDWEAFEKWCAAAGRQSMPATPAAVADHLSAMAATGKKPATISRRMTSIGMAHKTKGAPNPCKTAVVEGTMAGIRRTLGVKQDGKAAIQADDIRAMVATLPDTLWGARDKALLLVGFAGAFRRSELVNLQVEDLQLRREGLVIVLRRSKTDQEGAGETKAIPYGAFAPTCPVRALRDWLMQAAITSGPVFRGVDRHGNVLTEQLSDKTVARTVKAAAAAAGLDASRYSGHSLRAGFATAAAGAGATELEIMRQTGHKSSAMVRRYVREANLFKNNPVSRLGL